MTPVNLWPLRLTVHVLWLSCLVVPLVAVRSSLPGLLGLLVVAVACAITLPAGNFWWFAGAVLVSIPLIGPVTDLHAWAWVDGAAVGFGPLLVTGMWRWLVAGGFVLVSAVVGWVYASPGPYALISAVIGAVVLSMVALPLWFASLLDNARAGREARALLAVSEERLRFARDVHDLLGHRLTVIALKAELAGRLAASDPARAAAEAFAAQQLASSALSEVREAVDGYRAVDLPGQVTAVRNVLTDAGIRCTVTAAEVDGEAATQLALALREACTNVLRHSTASWCRIDIAESAGEVRMTVANNGARAVRSGNGLRGIAERLAKVGGGLETDLAADVFTLTAVVPT